MQKSPEDVRLWTQGIARTDVSGQATPSPPKYPRSGPDGPPPQEFPAGLLSRRPPAQALREAAPGAVALAARGVPVRRRAEEFQAAREAVPGDSARGAGGDGTAPGLVCSVGWPRCTQGRCRCRRRPPGSCRGHGGISACRWDWTRCSRDQAQDFPSAGPRPAG